MLFRRPDVISGTIAYGANGKEASEVQTAWRFLPQEKGETPCRAASSVGDRRERKKERKKSLLFGPEEGSNYRSVRIRVHAICDPLSRNPR